MTKLDKIHVGLEYCYDDEDLSPMKLHSVENANVFNSLAKITWTDYEQIQIYHYNCLHPLSPEKRCRYLAQAIKIKIGNDVW